MRHKRSQSSILIGLFLVWMFYFIIAILTPLTCDDWVWATDTGIERLRSLFDNYNGRYLGNIVEIIGTRSVIAKGLLMAVVNTLIVFFISKIIWEDTSNKNIFTVFVFVLVMPLSIFSQTYGWAAGFANYNTSILLTLMALYIFRNLIYGTNEDTPNSVISVLLIFILGLCSQLFAEHVTVYNLLFSLFLLVLSLFQRKSKIKPIAYLIGISLGTIIMFSNQAYLTILQGKDSYRTMENAGLFNRLVNIFSTIMSDQLIMNNMIINFCISVLLAIVICKSSKYPYLRIIFSSYLVFYPLYCFFGTYIMEVSFMVNSNLLIYLKALASFLYILTIGFSVLLFVNKDKLQIIFYVCSFALIAGPLFFVTPLSPRCFIASYMFLVLIVCNLLKLPENVKIYSSISTVIRYSSLVLTSIFIAVFIMINKNYSYRVDYVQIKVANGEKEIDFWNIPNEHFLYEATPNPNGYMEKNFKIYYNIPQDVELKRVTLK